MKVHLKYLIISFFSLMTLSNSKVFGTVFYVRNINNSGGGSLLNAIDSANTKAGLV